VTYSKYTSIVLEAVTQGSKVGGCPSKSLSLLKTTLFLFVISINISLSDDFVQFVEMAFDGYSMSFRTSYENSKPETAYESEIRIEKQKIEANDVALNKAEVRDGRYWIDGKWVSNKYKSANSKEELKDTDNDGYDDYFEFKNGTNPKDARSFPAIINGNNKKIFK
jgi:hypothetical protein